MLIITRRQGESFTIGDNVTVKIMRSDNGQTRIGIDAPKDVLILRSELEKREPKSEQ